MTQSVFTADALAGEIVLVTGASRGIGAAILDVCVKAGATVIGTATSDSGAAKISARIQELGGKGEGRVSKTARHRYSTNDSPAYCTTTCAQRRNNAATIMR